MRARLQTVTDWLGLTRGAKYDPFSMAAACRVTLRTLELFFHEQLGMSPSLWTMDVRCLDAEALLRRGFMTRAVASDLHFADAPHLCREIRKRYGVAPQEIFLLPSPSRHSERILMFTEKFRSGSIISLSFNRCDLARSAHWAISICRNEPDPTAEVILDQGSRL
jgi:AraC-like DNA-binding protein